MKRECLNGFFIILIISSISVISGQSFTADKHNSYGISIPGTQTPGVFYKNTDKNNSESTITNAPMKLSTSSINTITVIWPEPDYYYITDNFVLEIDTANPSSCTYTFNGETKDMIDNETNHYKFITGLIDNMASVDPYIIDFSCNDGSKTTTASTYFWINTTELDKYFIRSNLGNWNYINSQIGGYINENGFIEYYRAVYNPSNNDNINDRVDILIFKNKSSLEAGVKKYFLDEYGSDISVQSIGDKNFYVYTSPDMIFIAWKNGNYFVVNWVYPYQNTTPVTLEIPNDIIDPYLLKYPNDLRYGICGDGNINVLNLDGKKEDCDNNSEMLSCGSSVGECKIGQKVRKCKTDCTWGSYGVCNDTKPKTEICDGKDNNCDGKIDESFPLLNKTCYVGVGACRQEGKYICSLTGSNISCNAVAKAPQQENCNDGQDNDCDGFIDFNDTKDCIALKINSPINGVYYYNKNILFDIFSNHNPNDIIYSYFDGRGKEVTVKLCSKCNTYNKTKPLSDGKYNLTFAIGNKTQIFSKKQLVFLVDSTAPKISETLPKKGLTNGNFSIKFKENNPKILTLTYNNQKKNLNISRECILEKEVWSCNIKVNLSIFDGKQVRYYFNLTDITGKNTSSKPINLTVDTTLPKAKMNWTINGGKVNFIFNVTEINFYKISYIDYNNTKPKETVLCSKLKNNICQITKSFKIGQHNLTIFINDKAGNSLQKQINFKV